MNDSSATRSTAELEAIVPHLRQSPRDAGEVRLIVRRPAPGQRESLEVGMLDVALGLVGDCWSKKPHGETGSNDSQLTLMNTRFIEFIAFEPSRWPLAGDQLYVDFDLSARHLPPGTRLAVGDAELEITSKPHLGCRLFRARFGADALKFANSPFGRELNLRGIYACVVKSGAVRVGDLLRTRSA